MRHLAMTSIVHYEYASAQLARDLGNLGNRLHRTFLLSMTAPNHWDSIFPNYLAAALIISPFFYFSLFNGPASFHDNQRLIEISCVALALGIIAFRLERGMTIPLLFNRSMAMLMAAFLLLGLVSSATSYSPRHAFFEWSNLFLLMSASWIVAAEISTKGDALLDRLLMACGLACALYLLLEVAIYISVLKTGEQPDPRKFIFGFDNYRFFNHIQTISIPLLGLMAARLRDPGRQAFWWSMTAFWWMLLFVSAGRGTFVGLIVGIAVTWGTLRQTAAAWCRAMLLAGLAGLASYLLFYAAIPLMLGLEPFGFFVSTAERTLNSPASGRLLLWERALDMTYNHPWLGAGPMHFAHHARDLQIGAHPHNWVLQIASEWGIPALLLLSTGLARVAHNIRQLRQVITRDEQATLTAWLVTGVAILVDGLASGLFVMPTSQLWIAMYIGCAWGWLHRKSPASTRTFDYRPSTVERIAIVLAALLLLYALIQGIWPELRAQAEKDNSYADFAILMPRIFLNGTF